MADKKVSQLTALTGANAASGDLLYIVDVSEPVAADQSKKITLTEFQSAPVSAGTANGVAYLNGSKVLTTGSALTFDGTNLGIGTSSPQAKLHVDGGDFRNSSGTLPALSTSIVSGEIHSGLGNASTSDSGYLRLSAGGGTTLAVKAAIDIFREAGGATGVLFYTAGTERARITSVGNFKIGGTADRATTEGTNQLVLFNGTAPVGTLTNGVSFYSASGEARVMDAAGNSTLLSPHDQSTNEWIFHSKHTPTGKVLRIDVERLLKFVNDHFGLDAVHEFIED